MKPPRYSSFVQWFRDGSFAPYVRTIKSPGGILNLLEVERSPARLSP